MGLCFLSLVGHAGSWGEEALERHESLLSQTWLGPRLLLVCLLVSRSIAKEVSEHCSHMIGNGHLQILQQLVSMRPCLLLTEETEAAAGKQSQRDSFRENRGYLDNSHPDTALIDLLKVMTLGPPNPEALSGSFVGSE